MDVASISFLQAADVDGWRWRRRYVIAMILGMDAATANAITDALIALVVIISIVCATVIIVKRGWPTRIDLSGVLDREPMWKSETTTTYGPVKDAEPPSPEPGGLGSVPPTE